MTKRFNRKICIKIDDELLQLLENTARKYRKSKSQLIRELILWYSEEDFE